MSVKLPYMEDKAALENRRNRAFTGGEHILEIWITKEFWSINEAVKLICGRNPYERIPGPQLLNKSKRVIDLIDKAYADAQLGEIKVVRNGLLAIHTLVEPCSFIRWAIAKNLEIPEGLLKLADVDLGKHPEMKEALLKERVFAVKTTLLIISPEMTPEEILAHPAMTKLVPDCDVSAATKLLWLNS